MNLFKVNGYMDTGGNSFEICGHNFKFDFVPICIGD